MGILWHTFSLSSQEVLSPEVQLLESHSNSAAITFETVSTISGSVSIEVTMSENESKLVTTRSWRPFDHMKRADRGHRFQNQKSSLGFNAWYSSLGFKTRAINSQHQPYGFTNGPSGSLRWLPLPQVSGHMVPSGNDGDPYFREVSTPLDCAPVPPPVPQPLPVSAP